MKYIYTKVMAVFLCFTLLLPCFSSVSLALYGDEPEITAKAALLYAAESDMILYEHNIHEQLYPASLTKIMTALLTLENCEMDEVVTVTQSALNSVSPQSSIAGLKVDEELTVHDLLICLLIPSGNDAANVLAEHIGGSVSAFIDIMNERAAELGCENTNYVNASGLHDESHYTTAYDILLVLLEAQKYELFNEITASARMTIPATNISDERAFNNTNYLLSSHVTSKYLYDYAIGTKTGRTTPAGNCLVATAEKDGITLISVILGADTVTADNGTTNIRSFSETKSLFNWGYKKFSYRTVVNSTDAITEVPVALAEAKDYVILTPSDKVQAFVHNSVDDSAFEIKYTVDENIVAPVNQGDVLGKLRVVYDGDVIGALDLVAMNNVERNEILYFFSELQKFFSKPLVILAVVVIFILILLFIIYSILVNMSNNQRNASKRRRRQQRKY